MQLPVFDLPALDITAIPDLDSAVALFGSLDPLTGGQFAMADIILIFAIYIYKIG